MLIISQRKGRSFTISVPTSENGVPRHIKILTLNIDGNVSTLGIQADKDIDILRDNTKSRTSLKERTEST